MAELKGEAWIRAALNRLTAMKVIAGWEIQSPSPKDGSKWTILISKDLILHKSSGGAKAFVHGAMAGCAATIDQTAAARVLSDSTLKVEAKRRGMKILDD